MPTAIALVIAHRLEQEPFYTGATAIKLADARREWSPELIRERQSERESLRRRLGLHV